MPAEYFLSLILLMVAMFAAHFSGRSKLQSALLLAGGVVSGLLLVAYAAANSFTGDGINSAAFFHLQYGLAGAGFREYKGLILLCTAAISVTLAAFTYLCWSHANRPRKRPYLVISFALLFISLTVNPATWDIARNLKPVSQTTANFLRHYRTPRITPISDEHPNFVFIFAESLERTYFDEDVFPGLIKELRLLENEGISFTNIHSLDGTGFTMGGIVASLCGIPLFSPAHPNAMSGMDAFLPGAIGLTDLLHEQNYHLAYMGGASLQFAGKGKFLRTHRFDEVLGFSELHGQVVDKSYINNWGLYDDTLFEMAFARMEELAQRPKPFGFFLLTLDTHHPDGHVSRSAVRKRFGDGTNTMLNAVAASDQLLSAFVRRIQNSSFGANTVVVIASDHLAMNNAASGLLQRGERRNLFLVLDPRNAREELIDRTGSTLDTGTTLLPFLGYKGAIGLGRDLRDTRTQDEEIAHIHRAETIPSWRNEIMNFWRFPQLKDQLVFSEEKAEVVLDGRRFTAPVLIELMDEYDTRLKFEFDALYDVRLAQQAEQLVNGTPFLLIATREDATPFLSEEERAGSAWVMIIGKAGMRRIVLPLTDGTTLSRAEIDGHLAMLTQ